MICWKKKHHLDPCPSMNFPLNCPFTKVFSQQSMLDNTLFRAIIISWNIPIVSPFFFYYQLCFFSMIKSWSFSHRENHSPSISPPSKKIHGWSEAFIILVSSASRNGRFGALRGRFSERSTHGIWLDELWWARNMGLCRTYPLEMEVLDGFRWFYGKIMGIYGDTLW